MSKNNVLLEFYAPQSSPFEMQATALNSEDSARAMARSFLDDLPGQGIDVNEDVAPVPMFLPPGSTDLERALSFSVEMNNAANSQAKPMSSSETVVVPAELTDAALERLRTQDRVMIWPSSELTLFPASVDCGPFKPAATIDQIRQALGFGALANHRGNGVVVGIIDEGVNGAVYPVTGGFSRPGAGQQPGTAPITSHGSMCAADILIAAPEATLYDYPFLGVPNSGGALQMFQAVLNQRAIDGTPHITNNSYGFTGVPPKATSPNHEVHDPNHPVHRKVREVVLAGVSCFFAAGNCGADCPSGNCQANGIGPGRSIHASNSLEEVITVAAVNLAGERIGYSSQGEGMFFRQKPDIASYSHIFANFGPGRPGGLAEPFDNGTSAATPVAAGVAAALLSAFPGLSPARLKTAMIATAQRSGGQAWDRDFGAGILNMAAAFQHLP